LPVRPLLATDPLLQMCGISIALHLDLRDGIFDVAQLDRCQFHPNFVAMTTSLRIGAKASPTSSSFVYGP
jgi:hypothetical protein